MRCAVLHEIMDSDDDHTWYWIHQLPGHAYGYSLQQLSGYDKTIHRANSSAMSHAYGEGVLNTIRPQRTANRSKKKDVMSTLPFMTDAVGPQVECPFAIENATRPR